MFSLSARSLSGFVTVVSLLAIPFMATGCAAEGEDDEAGESGAEVNAALKARRQLSYTCPKGTDPIKVAFFDADSTLRVSKQNAVTANAVDDVDILPFAAKNVGALSKQGFLIAIVSNQGGIAAGKVTFAVAEGALVNTAKKLGRLGGRVNYLDFAEGSGDDRKPGAGMANRLDDLLKKKCGRGIDRKLSTMTGDSGYKMPGADGKGGDGPHPDGRPADDFSNSDRLFAESVGIPFAEPTDAFGWRDYGVYNVLGEKELLPFLDAIAKRAQDARDSGDTKVADELDAEVAANRKENALPVAAAKKK